MSYRLSAHALCKHYGERNVVHNIDLTIVSGEIIGILGPNGAGKTTTFYILVGLIEPDSGNVILNQEDITQLPMYRRARLGIGYLPQESSIFKKLSVYDNLKIIAENLPIDSEKINSTIYNSLEEFGIRHLSQQKAYTLSGGERRRLEIARTLMINPRFLLLDEPFSGVDPISVADIQNIIAHLKEKGIGILITDHNVRETLAIVDRAYLIHEGKVLCEGDHSVLLNDPQSRKLYLGERFSM
ncbi:MAG: LPS export ABC transporter ATP-binding protein [Puniceicoccales bacterium]|jgi:lipopolysaccharide export system ATP-binding protein|nr:LPS export ABC transporter ATP-binding protein [Puniceicoccales bacterium]